MCCFVESNILFENRWTPAPKFLNDVFWVATTCGHSGRANAQRCEKYFPFIECGNATRIWSLSFLFVRYVPSLNVRNGPSVRFLTWRYAFVARCGQQLPRFFAKITSVPFRYWSFLAHSMCKLTCFLYNLTFDAVRVLARSYVLCDFEIH